MLRILLGLICTVFTIGLILGHRLVDILSGFMPGISRKIALDLLFEFVRYNSMFWIGGIPVLYLRLARYVFRI